jgi:hypothetical protein
MTILSSRRANVYINTYGGNKKQGLASTTNKSAFMNKMIQSGSWGQNRNKFVCMNQLGGVGVGRSSFRSNAAGLNCIYATSVAKRYAPVDSILTDSILAPPCVLCNDPDPVGGFPTSDSHCITIAQCNARGGTYNVNNPTFCWCGGA